MSSPQHSIAALQQALPGELTSKPSTSDTSPRTSPGDTEPQGKTCTPYTSDTLNQKLIEAKVWMQAKGIKKPKRPLDYWPKPELTPSVPPGGPLKYWEVD